MTYTVTRREPSGDLLWAALNVEDVWEVRGPDGVHVVARRAGSGLLFCSCKLHHFCPHSGAVKGLRASEAQMWDTNPPAA